MVSPHAANTSGTTTRQRFGYFFLGLAIGVVLLGFFASHKQQAEREEAARQAGGQAAGASMGRDNQAAPSASDIGPADSDTP
ncbi:MAG TPA: hypothetical protein ENK11_10195 [Phycisphaerales bacterium]|nr:hypothetical protein [Phycisphaerales bacterium]